MATWTRQAQTEQNGSYFFCGTLLISDALYAELWFEEIVWIYSDARNFAEQQNGIAKQLLYLDSTGRAVDIIASLNNEQLESGLYQNDDHFCLLAFASEINDCGNRLTWCGHLEIA